ncbi:MICOS complex subunit MIC60 isoform X2 [Macrobrachium rosenbergii]|uniref:MICOS complex subunit MIC60 isoform X2 n=1 Tax=Macrobrachium rosenbergii TaxID=79674 RepID=UPI0034D74DCB
MLRLTSRLNSHVTSKVVRAGGGRRLQSTYSGGGGGSGKVLIGAAVATTGVAGVVGYSSWSPENRKGVEKVIPGSGIVLGKILGPLPESEPPKPPKPDVGLVRKKLEREKKKKKEEPEIEEAKPEPVPVVEDVSPEPGAASTEAGETQSVDNASPVIDEQAPADALGGISPEIVGGETTATGLTIITTTGHDTKPESIPAASLEEAKPAVSDLEERLASGEVAEGVENAALVQTLDDLAALAQNQITSALVAAEDAAVIIRKHAEKAYQAIDAGQDKELLFAAVSELSAKRSEVVQAAQEKIAAAVNTIEQLKEQIKSGYESKLTKDNKAIIAAEEKLGDLKYAVENIKALISESERDGKVVSDYKDLIESGREQFETELRSLLPEVKLGETSDKLTTDELNLLIAHAHRKVLQLQKQVARQQSIEHDRFKEALTKQRDEDTKILEARISAELEKQGQDLEVEYRRKVAQLREDLEGELRAQLKRQAAAHSDHLADVLSVQEKELETKWLSRLDDEVHSVKTKYLTSLSEVQGQLEGLKNAMTARADVDKAAYAARELWLACESLRSALRLGAEQAKSWEEQLKPLSDHVKAIKTAGGEANPYITAVLNAIPEEAVERGVYTEEAIKERFIKVERICKRVSMIGDNGGSLLRYLLSYMQSFLILNAFEYLPGAEVRDEEIAVDSLSTYEILARARYCLDKDDLSMSIRYMNLLRGEPRNVAAGWLKEARLTLEARQAADALLAHAAATAVKAR